MNVYLSFWLCRGWRLVSISQWPLSMAANGFWQQETDQLHCYSRQIQQLWLGNTVPDAIQWYREKLEAISPRWKCLGKWLYQIAPFYPFQIYHISPELGGLCLGLTTRFCFEIVAKEKYLWYEESGYGAFLFFSFYTRSQICFMKLVNKRFRADKNHLWNLSQAVIYCKNVEEFVGMYSSITPSLLSFQFC